LTVDKKHNVDLKAAMWCYKSSYPFNMYESPDTQDFIHDINPAYDPPNRQDLSGGLLDEVYAKVKERSGALITNLNHINVSTDKSTNINTNRIANISVQSKYGALHFVSEDLKAKRMTATAASE
jgi:hypothetical protein